MPNVCDDVQFLPTTGAMTTSAVAAQAAANAGRTRISIQTTIAPARRR